MNFPRASSRPLRAALAALLALTQTSFAGAAPTPVNPAAATERIDQHTLREVLNGLRAL